MNSKLPFRMDWARKTGLHRDAFQYFTVPEIGHAVIGHWDLNARQVFSDCEQALRQRIKLLVPWVSVDNPHYVADGARWFVEKEKAREFTELIQKYEGCYNSACTSYGELATLIDLATTENSAPWVSPLGRTKFHKRDCILQAT